MENILSHLLVDGIRKALLVTGDLKSIDQNEIIRNALKDLEAEIAPQASGANLTHQVSIHQMFEENKLESFRVLQSMTDRVFSFELNQMLDSFSDLLLADPFDRQILELVAPLMKNQRVSGVLLEKITSKNHRKGMETSVIFSKWLKNIDENLIYLTVLSSLVSKQKFRPQNLQEIDLKFRNLFPSIVTRGLEHSKSPQRQSTLKFLSALIDFSGKSMNEFKLNRHLMEGDDFDPYDLIFTYNNSDMEWNDQDRDQVLGKIALKASKTIDKTSILRLLSIISSEAKYFNSHTDTILKAIDKKTLTGSEMIMTESPEEAIGCFRILMQLGIQLKGHSCPFFCIFMGDGLRLLEFQKNDEILKMAWNSSLSMRLSIMTASAGYDLPDFWIYFKEDDFLGNQQRVSHDLKDSSFTLHGNEYKNAVEKIFSQIKRIEDFHSLLGQVAASQQSPNTRKRNENPDDDLVLDCFVEMIDRLGICYRPTERSKLLQYLEAAHKGYNMAFGEINWTSLHVLKIFKDIGISSGIMESLHFPQTNNDSMRDSMLLVDEIVEKTDKRLFDCLKRHEIWPSLIFLRFFKDSFASINPNLASLLIVLGQNFGYRPQAILSANLLLRMREDLYKVSSKSKDLLCRWLIFDLPVMISQQVGDIVSLPFLFSSLSFERQ